MAGQAILATSIKEKIWASREVPRVPIPGDLVPMLVRILRGSSGHTITVETIMSIDLALKRDSRHPGTPEYVAAKHRLGELWRMLADVGVGQILHDDDGHQYLRKYALSGMSFNTLRWLAENRVPPT